MKKLIAIILIIIGFLLMSCGQPASDGSSSSSSETSDSSETDDGDTDDTGDDDATDDTEPEPEIPQTAVKYAFIGAGILYFNDVEQENANPRSCGNRCFTDENLAKVYDDYGSMIYSYDIDPDAAFVNGDWWIRSIDPATAQSLGGRFKDYSEIYQGDILVSEWFLNEWKTVEMFETMSGDVFARDSANALHSLTGISSIHYAKDLLIHDFDTVNHTTIMEHNTVYSVSWLHNYFDQARHWLELDGVWYSQNGYELSDDLYENANALQSWNVEPHPIVVSMPTVISAGVWDSKTFWIECNTGTLISHDPTTDTIETVASLYDGDGERMTGVGYADSLRPFVSESSLFYNISGSIMRLDLETGFFNLFFGGEGEFFGW